MLHPVIRQSSPGVYEITVQPGAVSPPGNDVTVTVMPTAQPGQRALLELLQTSAPMAANLFDAGSILSATGVLTFDIGALGPGDYLVRIRIDGAESPLQLNAQGKPVAPVITL